MGTTPKGRERLQETPTGLIVVRYEMTPEMKKKRREDNKAMREIRKRRKRNKHGRQHR